MWWVENIKFTGGWSFKRPHAPLEVPFLTFPTCCLTTWASRTNFCNPKRSRKLKFCPKKKNSFPTKFQCLFINQYLLLCNVYNLTAAALYPSFHVPIGIISSPPSNPTTDFLKKGTGCNYNPKCCSSDYWNVDISLKWAAFPHQTRNQEILISFRGKKADVNFFFHPSFLLPTDLGKS